MYNIRNGSIRWQISNFLSDGNSNVFSISHRLWDICKNKKTDKTSTLKVKIYREGQGQRVEERDLRYLTENVNIHIGDFITILATWVHTFTQKADTARNRLDDYRQIVDLPTNWSLF